MFKICIVTSTRADYGIMQGLISKMSLDNEIDFRLCVTGTHLSNNHGYTRKYISINSSLIDEIDILDTSENVQNVCCEIVKRFTTYFSRHRFDMVVLLGDRYEIFYIASVAYLCKTKIAHIHGGENSFGSLDDGFRHCITKLSNIHFASCEKHRQRIIQMGENPRNVYNVGSLSVENIQKMHFKSKKELAIKYKYDLKKYAMLTFNPVTREKDNGLKELHELFKALSRYNYELIVIMPNIDSGKDDIINFFKNTEIINIHFISSIMYEDYISFSKNCDLFIGNSSSGIIEIPSLRVPIINVGNRQMGREMPESVISCLGTEKEITKAIEYVATDSYKKILLQSKNIYYKPNSSDKIIHYIKKFLSKPNQKKFYDIK